MQKRVVRGSQYVPVQLVRPGVRRLLRTSTQFPLIADWSTFSFRHKSLFVKREKTHPAGATNMVLSFFYFQKKLLELDLTYSEYIFLFRALLHTFRSKPGFKI